MPTLKGITRTKIFDHKRYRLHWPYTKKADALRYQRKVEAEGYLTRLVRAPKGTGYAWLLYKKKKLKARAAVATRVVRRSNPTSKRGKWVWMRRGEPDDYNKFDSPYAAGEDLGAIFSSHSSLPAVSRHGDKGVNVGSLSGYNYVSLFWGDSDAQPTVRAKLTDAELRDFRAGMKEGFSG